MIENLRDLKKLLKIEETLEKFMAQLRKIGINSKLIYKLAHLETEG